MYVKIYRDFFKCSVDKVYCTWPICGHSHLIPSDKLSMELLSTSTKDSSLTLITSISLPSCRLLVFSSLTSCPVWPLSCCGSSLFMPAIPIIKEKHNKRNYFLLTRRLYVIPLEGNVGISRFTRLNFVGSLRLIWTMFWKSTQ